MFLVPTVPTRNFLDYDRILRRLMVSDAMDRIARGEAETRILGRPGYRGPTADFIGAYAMSNPFPPSAEAVAAR